jgi:gas vesicle protein
MFKTKHSYVDFLEGVLIGGSLAAAATFVFGTAKGKKLQKEVLAKYKKLGHKAEHYLDNVKKAVKGPMAKKLKRLAKKTLNKKSVRKAFRTVRRKSTAKRAGR